MEDGPTPAVLMLDLPPAALAGIDLLSFTTTPRFRGVKNLPSGWHFVFTGSSTAFSIRHGIWFEVTSPANLSPSRAVPLLVTKWEARSEQLEVETDETEVLRWRANLGQIWSEGMTPYRQSAANNVDGEEAQAEDIEWPQLTSHITAALLSRITQGDTQHWTLTSASSATRDVDDLNIPGLSSAESKLAPEKELRFLPIELKQTWRTGAVGRERTDAAQDRSWALASLVQDHCSDHNPLEIIGELQFCFLMVLTLNNFSCLEQWKRILTLLLTCKAAVSTRAELHVQFLSALKLQLQHCKDAEGGLFDLADEGGSLLRSLLVRFRRGLEGLGGMGIQHVVDELDDLEEFLRDEHGWQFGGVFARSGVLELEDGEQVRMDTTAFDEDEETGEFAPQVVDLSPEQLKLLGVGNAGELATNMRKPALHDEDDSDEELDEQVHDRAEEPEVEEDLEEMDARF